jgi:predicted TPR repeat methyltransferase
MNAGVDIRGYGLFQAMRVFFNRTKGVSMTDENITLADALSIANQHLKSRNAPLAEKIFHEILKAYPNEPNCFHQLAVIAFSRGDFSVATEFFAKSIDYGFVSVETYTNLASSLRKVGRTDEAVSAFNMAISIDANFATTHLNLGNLFKDTGKIDDAVTCYKTALKLDPDNTKAAYNLRILTDNHTGSPTNEFISLINDESADYFEQNMENQKSQIPKIVRAAADKVLMDNGSSLTIPIPNVLDLGCGTGRSGVEFRNISNSLDGVDLSSNMMDKAREKEVYDALLLDNFVNFMAKKKDVYDLVIAVDSLIYTGPLDAIFDGVYRVLKNPGAFTFTVEAMDSGDFSVQHTSRHSHSEGYIRNLADERDFNVLLCEPIDDMRAGVKGTLFWLEKSG